MEIKLPSSPAPEELKKNVRSNVHGQDNTLDMISNIRRGVHTVWGGMGANEERKLREVLQKLADDIDGLERTLSETTKRKREDDKSASDNKRNKSVDEDDDGVDEEGLNAIEAWFRHCVYEGDELWGLLALIDFHKTDPESCKVGHDVCCNLRKKVEVAAQSMGCDWEEIVGPLAREVSTHLKYAGENLEDVLDKFKDYAKKIEPRPESDRLQPSKKDSAFGNRVKPPPSPFFLSDNQTMLPSSSCRPHVSSRTVASTPIQTKKSQDVAYLSNVPTVSWDNPTSHKSGHRSQPETTESCRIFSNSKKVHWNGDKKTDSGSGKDSSGDRSETSDEDDSDEWSDSDQEPESDGDDYSDEDDGGEHGGDDNECNIVRVNQEQIEFLTTMLEQHDRQKEPSLYCSGEHEDLEGALQMCKGLAGEKTGEMMIEGVAYEIAEHLYAVGLSPRKTLKSCITSGKSCEWSPWSKVESVAARKLKPWFRERAWYSDKN